MTSDSNTITARPVLKLAKPRRPPIEQLYVVWSPSRRRPRERHRDKSSAITEAERLAALHLGMEFIVYEMRAIDRKVVTP